MLKEKLDKLDLLIRNGMGKFARQELRQIASHRIKRDELYRVANLARRVNLPHYSIKLLNPIVRPTGKQKAIPASVQECAEYAASLTYVGAAEEAFQILKKLNPKDIPQVLLFEAFALFAQWNYAQSIPLLEQYLATAGLNSYDRLVGQVNLVAAFIYEREFTKAEHLLTELKSSTHQSQHSLLYGNILELSAQNYILKQDYDKASEALTLAKEHLTEEGGHGEFFIKKWSVILNFLQSDDPSALQSLHALKNQAESIHPGTVRDCDRFEAIKTKNVELLLRLYFGTPFESYRIRLLKDFGYTGVLPDFYHWAESSKGEVTSSLELNKGAGIGSQQNPVKIEGVLHRLLIALSNDFYIAKRLASFHHQLYPNEYYNPLTSPQRVHASICRLKTWFKENKIALTIQEKNGFYLLIATGNVQLTIPRIQNLHSNNDELFLKILKKWPTSKFSAKEFSVEFDLSLRTAQRILLEYISEGKLMREGLAGATRYAVALPAMITEPKIIDEHRKAA